MKKEGGWKSLGKILPNYASCLWKDFRPPNFPTDRVSWYTNLESKRKPQD